MKGNIDSRCVYIIPVSWILVVAFSFYCRAKVAHVDVDFSEFELFFPWSFCESALNLCVRFQ